MERFSRCIRRMSLAVRFGSEDVMVRRCAVDNFELLDYLSNMQAYHLHTYNTRSFLDDSTIERVSAMKADEKSALLLNHVTEILVGDYEDLNAPMPVLLPETVNVSRARVFSSDATLVDGMIFARLYGSRNQILATIEVGDAATTVFYTDDQEPSPPIGRSRREIGRAHV